VVTSAAVGCSQQNSSGQKSDSDVITAAAATDDTCVASSTHDVTGPEKRNDDIAKEYDIPEYNPTLVGLYNTAIRYSNGLAVCTVVMIAKI